MSQQLDQFGSSELETTCVAHSYVGTLPGRSLCASATSSSFSRLEMMSFSICVVITAVCSSVARYSFWRVASSPCASACATNFGLSPMRSFSSRKVEILTQLSG